MKIALFPGSFDPITIGHQSLVLRTLPLFDKVIVAIGNNTSKKSRFPLDKRIAWIKKSFPDNNAVEVLEYSELTVDFCQEIGAKYVIRGVRNAIDYNYENSIAQMNKKLNDSVETIFVPAIPEHSPISSTIVRDIVAHNGDVRPFLPEQIKDDF